MDVWLMFGVSTLELVDIGTSIATSHCIKSKNHSQTRGIVALLAAFALPRAMQVYSGVFLLWEVNESYSSMASMHV